MKLTAFTSVLALFFYSCVAALMPVRIDDPFGRAFKKPFPACGHRQALKK